MTSPEARPDSRHQELIAYYEQAGPDSAAWSSALSMHFGYYRFGFNPFRRERMLDEMNRQVIERLQLNADRRDLIVRLLNAVPGITCKVPGGAFYAWPNVTEACRRVNAADSEAFRKRLLHEAGIAVLADIHFGRRVPGDGQHIRFSYAASTQAIEEGIGRLDAFVRKHGV